MFYFFVYLTGLEVALSCGSFIINAPHKTFRSPAYWNSNHDPFPRLQEVTMEKGDALLVTRPKSGAQVIKLVKMVEKQ